MDEIDEIILKRLEEGVIQTQIAEEFGVTDAAISNRIRKMREKGIYVVAFSYPVVPKGKARIRTQVCAAHSKEDIDFIIECFKQTRDELR